MKKLTNLFLLLLVFQYALTQTNVSFYAENTSGCAPLTATFTSNSTFDAGVLQPVKYYWEIDYQSVGGNDTAVSFNFSAGNHSVKLTVHDFNDIYVGEYYENVDISGYSDFIETSVGDSACPNEEINLHFNSFNTDVYASGWDFGDGSNTEGNWVQHKYPDPGIYNVQVIIDGSCGFDTLTRTITVNSNAIPDIKIHAQGGDYFCIDDAIQFETEGNYSSYQWHFKDGTVSYNPQPIHAYLANGEYHVKLIATNLCGNTSSDSTLITIADGITIDAGFHYWPDYSVCPGKTITFEPYSSGIHHWDLGNGFTTQFPKPYTTYEDTGDYNVVHIIENGCGNKDTVEQIISVDYTYESVYDYVDFCIENIEEDYKDTIYICPGEELIFKNNTYSGDLKFQWIFSDGDTIRSYDAQKIFGTVGVYNMFLKAINDCRGEGYSSTKVIVVDASIKPKTNMAASPRYICPGETIYFYNDGEDDEYVKYSYDVIFGDGQEERDITEITDPDLYTIAQHAYASTGNYEFYFIATNSCGNKDTLSGTIFVDNDATRKPAYHVNNSTQSHDDEEMENWGERKDVSDNEFIIPLRWLTWTPSQNNQFYVYFWYGDIDLMGGEEDPGMPAGVVELVTDSIVAGDTVTAYVPFNPFNPQVTIAAAWYCDTIVNVSLEPDNFALPVDGTFTPISGQPLTSGGTTTYENVLDFPEFTGMCNSQKLDGSFISEAGMDDLFLEFWEDDETHILKYELFAAEDRYSSNRSTISKGYYNQIGSDTVVFNAEEGTCFSSGSYIYSISGDSLTFALIDDPCTDRETTLSGNVFMREFDKGYDLSGCPGDLVKFIVAGGASYEWHFGDGATSTEPIAYHAYQDTGHYDAFVIVTNNCGRTDTVYSLVTIGLHNTPEAYFGISDYYIEAGEVVNFFLDHRGDFDPNQYLWDFGDGSGSTTPEPAHIFQDGGEYNVNLKVTNGCGSAFTDQTIYVKGSTNLCNLEADFNFEIHGDTVYFFEASSGNIPTKFIWNFGNETGSNKANPVKVYPEAGIYYVCLTVVDSISGCSDTWCEEITIGNLECLAHFESNIDNDNNSVYFIDQSTNAAKWSWSFGDNTFSTVQNPQHTYNQPGLYEVKLSIRTELGDCSHETVQHIFVGYSDSIDCFVNFTYDVEDLTVNFIADVSENITNGFWKFGDGHIAHDKEVTHIYAKSGEYKVCATVFDTINGCQRTICKTIFVGTVDCQAGYTFILNNDYSVEFYNESAGNNLEYFWDFGDGYFSGETDPTHTFIPGEVYTVCLAINDTVLDCYSDYCLEIAIADSAENNLCTPEMSYFVEDGTFNVVFDEVSGQTFTEYYWNFGDGNFSNLKSPEHSYNADGIYEVCLQVYDDSTDCGDGVCDKVIINTTSTNIASVNASFGYFVNQLTDVVTFNDKSTGNVTSRYWTFGDGKMAVDSVRIKHHYVVPKTYEACLIVVDEVNGLKSKVCREIIVGDKDCNLVAGFNYVIDPVDNLVKFVDNTKGTANKWFWNFDDGTTSQRPNPFHMYDGAGFYLVKLAVRDTVTECNDVHFELVQVGAVDCKALFEYEVDPDSLKVEFTNTSRGNIADYYWYFGDHSSSNEENPVKYFDKPGLYRVALAVSDGTGDCADYVVVPVQVGEVTCEADFEVFIDSLDNVAYFENKSIGNIDKFRWFFGDGYQSTLENPVHFYPAAGYYTVRLVTASGDCMSKDEETILIGAQGSDCEADFFANIDENSQTVKFIDQSLGENLAYIWNFGDDSISTEQNPVYTYETGGYYNVCLTVINGDGISNTTCKFIQVSTEDYNSCFADFIYTADSTTKTVAFTDLSAGDPNRWIWHFGDGAKSNEQNPTHTYNEGGFYRVKLISGDTTSGCASLTIDLVNVAETADGLVAGFGYQIDSLSLKGTGKPVDFIGVSAGKSSNITWDFGDGNTDSTTLTPTNIYTESGKYEVCFTVSDPITGMSDTYCDSVTVQLATYVDQLFDDSYSLIVYPNPFMDEMKIRYRLDSPADVNIDVYDELGRLVDIIVKDYKYEGEHEVIWSNEALRNGIYNLRMRTNNGVVKNLRIIKN